MSSEPSRETEGPSADVTAAGPSSVPTAAGAAATTEVMVPAAEMAVAAPATSQDDQTGGSAVVGAGDGGSGGDTFHLFHLFPAEIQNLIWTEAIRKPGLHFVRVKRKEPRGASRGWIFGLLAVSKGQDQSAYRATAELATACEGAQTAFRLATERRERVPISRVVSSDIDAVNDVVLFEFPRRVSLGIWNPINQIAIVTNLDRDNMMERVRGIQNVAIRYDHNQPRTNEHATCLFSCYNPAHRHDPIQTICPEELAGFLGYFPDLKRVYIVLPWGRDVTRRNQHTDYTNRFFSDEMKNARHEQRLQIFWTKQRPMIELRWPRPDGWADDVPVNQADPWTISRDRVPQEEIVINLKRDTKTYLLLDDSTLPTFRPNAITDYRMSLEARRRLEFHTLLDVDKRHPAIGRA